MLDLRADITGLRGADYNPRRIGEDELAVLADSIARLGLVKPLIVRGDLLVAGHQRTKALRRLGVTEAAVYRLPCDTTTYDEVRFNQLHNGTDMDCGEEAAKVLGGFEPGVLGYVVVPPERVTGNFRCRMANVRSEITALITKYGPWGGVVATASGEIIHCAQYALAAAMCRVPLTCYVIPDARADEYRGFLNRTYGVFSYDNLPRDTFIQTFAQLMRLRDGESGKQFRSTLYEGMLLPWLETHRDAVVLDFGAGQGDYAKRARSLGYKVHDLELFRRAGGQHAIDVGAVNRMIDRALGVVRAGGYDAVVCDSVFNSVDSLEAESAVATCLNAFAKVGAPIFFSGRSLYEPESQMRRTKTVGAQRRVEFLDEHNFSALYRKGRWFYQKFHDEAQVRRLAKRHALTVDRYTEKLAPGTWQVAATKAADLSREDVEAALLFEFDQRVSDTRSLGRSGDAIAAFREKDVAAAN